MTNFRFQTIFHRQAPHNALTFFFLYIFVVVKVQALDVERRMLEAALEQCRDELGDAKSLAEQLKLENTRKVRKVK